MPEALDESSSVKVIRYCPQILRKTIFKIKPGVLKPKLVS